MAPPHSHAKPYWLSLSAADTKFLATYAVARAGLYDLMGVSHPARSATVSTAPRTKGETYGLEAHKKT